MKFTKLGRLIDGQLLENSCRSKLFLSNMTNSKCFAQLKLHPVNTTKVRRQVALFIEDSCTDVAFEGLDITNSMNRRKVIPQMVFMHKLPAANLTLVSGVRALWFTATLSMRRVVVHTDR